MVYVMADIHGHMKRFRSILSQIDLQPEDQLYILGDVVDRNPDGIKILRMLMKMPNVKMIIGNHECMMMLAVERHLERLELKRYADTKELAHWYRNGGEVTHNSLRRLRKDLRSELFAFLRQLPFNLDVEVGGRKFKLVHAAPLEYYETDEYFRERYGSPEKFSVWYRWPEGPPAMEGATMIFGHTATIHYQPGEPLRIWKKEGVIGIDCGCGYAQGRLACLRLDDMKEFYSVDE